MRAHYGTRESVVVRVVPGQVGGEPLDGVLVTGIRVDEAAQPIGEPAERDLLLAPPLGQLLDPTIGEVHANIMRPATYQFIDRVNAPAVAGVSVNVRVLCCRLGQRG